MIILSLFETIARTVFVIFVHFWLEISTCIYSNVVDSHISMPRIHTLTFWIIVNYLYNGELF